MTAPVLAHKKFYIIKPEGGVNQIKNPRFDMPDGKEDWTAIGAGVTIAETGDEQRFGAYSMKVNPANNTSSGAYHGGLTVANTLAYTFSCYVKGVAGQAMRLVISNAANAVKATTRFTATGYWQRVEVTHTAAENAATYRAKVLRDAVASTAVFYVDGAQFETAGAATTLMSGYTKGCKWAGAVRNSSSYRDPNSADYAAGGWIVDLEDYCHIVQAVGLGHGDWNQIMTKMTSGGDMYQTHIRKSRQFSIIVDFLGNSLSEIENNRKAVIDLIRPDLAEGQERIVRYQGVDVNGYEATQPLDIKCVPLPATLTDTPDLPTYQRAVLNFAIPSGLLDGAYHEGEELDLYANFPAEYIVKRDPQGNWCKWNGTGYDNSLKGQGTVQGLNGIVYCMAEGPDGKIYVGGNFTNAGGVAAADYLARWNPVSEAWEAVGNPTAGSAVVNAIHSIAFDANGDLYVGGNFTAIGGIIDADRIAKFTVSTATWSKVVGRANANVYAIAISPDGLVYIGGDFTSVGDQFDPLNPPVPIPGTSANGIAYYDGAAWYQPGAGMGSGQVNALKFMPNGSLIIGGTFNASAPAGAYICKWTGTAFESFGGTALNNEVMTVDITPAGKIIIGGRFTNAGGDTKADGLAYWGGSDWMNLSTNSGDISYTTYLKCSPNGAVYICGSFTKISEISVADKVAMWANGAWQPLDIDLPGNGATNAILPASDGSLYISGNFSTTVAGENAKTGIVALNLELTSASANTYPYMQVFGPGTLKAITNYTTGKSVMFDGLTLNAGETIALNFDPLNLVFKSAWSGRGNLMRYIVPGSDYGDFYLRPGGNALSLFMDGTDENSGAWIAWTPLFWGLDGAVLE